jgi:hypothetical protein
VDVKLVIAIIGGAVGLFGAIFAYTKFLTQAPCTYSEIVWLGAASTVRTRANANRTTGLPNSYGPIGGEGQQP